MKSINSSYPKTYYRKSQFKTFVLFVALVIFAAFVKVPTTLVIVLSGFAILMGYSAIQICLVVSPEGVEYYQVGYSVKITWSNVARIGEIPAGQIMAEGLILHQSALFVDNWLAGVKYIQTRGKLIPLSLFERAWSGSEPGQDIKKFAPHLFARM